MTAVQKQTVKVYIADFSKCSSKAGFYRLLILTFGLKISVLQMNSNDLWRVLCERIHILASGCVPVRVRISGLENVYSFYSTGVETLLRVFRAAEEQFAGFRTDIKIGNAVWHCR